MLREEDVVRILGRFVAAARGAYLEFVHASDRFQGIPCFAELRAEEVVDALARRQSLKGLQRRFVEVRHPPVRRRVVFRTGLDAPRAARFEVSHVFWGRKFPL